MDPWIFNLRAFMDQEKLIFFFLFSVSFSFVQYFKLHKNEGMVHRLQAKLQIRFWHFCRFVIQLTI
jgi:hypothetical protein